MSAPGIWRKVPGWLRRSARPAGDPLVAICRGCCPGCSRFLRAGATRAKLAAMRTRAATAAGATLRNGIARLAEEAGVGELITRQGVLFVLPGSRRLRSGGAGLAAAPARTAYVGWNWTRTNCASANRR